MDQQTEQPLFELQVDYDSGNTIKEMSKWARFISITYMVIMGLLLIAMIFASTAAIEFVSNLRPEIAGLGAIAFGIIILAVGVFIFIAIQLYRFADMTRQGVERQDQELFNSGLKSLKTYLMVSGIVGMLSLALNILVTILKATGSALLETTY